MMNDNNMKPLLIIGSGAMASLFAARLSAAGIPVVMLAGWPQAVEAIRSRGLCLVAPDGREVNYPVQVVSSPADCAGVSYALVLVKSWQTSRAAVQLAACLAPHGLALTLQNGVGNWELLSQTLGPERTALGVTTVGANLIEPGRVRAAGEGVITLSVHPRMDLLANLFRRAGFTVETTNDTDALVWGKLVINAAINPLTALLDVPNGALLEQPEARSLLAAAASEAAGVAAAQGIRLPYPDPVAAVETVAGRTSQNLSSMLQDLQRGAPTEVEAINGAIVRAGEKTGILTPVHRTLYRLVKARAARAEEDGRCHHA